MVLRAARRRAVAALTALVTAGLGACAAQGGREGGAANLPNRGVAGWTALGTTEEPFVIVAADDAEEVVAGPCALVVGDETVVWFHAEGPDGVVVRRAASVDGVTFDAPVDVLAGGRDPSVARAADGRFWMAFEDEDGSVGLAASDDGRAFAREATTGLPAGHEPSLVLVDDRLVVFVVVDGAIERFEAGADRAFTTQGVVLAPGVDCADAFGEPEPCWDETELGGPDVRLARTATGRRVWRMFYAGRSGLSFDLGFAASFDGVEWTRYAFNPVVEADFSQRSPSAVVRDDGYGLYWSEPRSATYGGIVLATTPDTEPAELW